MLKKPSMPLLELPNEVLLLIAESLVEFRDLYALLRTNRRLAVLLANTLYRLAGRSGLDFGIVALLWAAASRNEPMLRVVLSVSSPRITIKAQHGQVLCAVSRPDISISSASNVGRVLAECTTIRVRVKKGRRTSCERPALHWAAGTGNRALIRLLLDRGADVHARDRYGHTALHCAAAMNRETAVELLLRRGADRHVFAFFGETPLDRAMYYEHFGVVMMLLEGADIAATYQYGRTALHVAAGYPVDDVAAKVVKSLLDKGADIGALATGPGLEYVVTSIGNAIFRGNEKVVKVLLDAGGWRNQPKYHDSIIQVAIDEKHYQIARLLLEAAPADYRESDRGTLLHMAIDLPSADIALVRMLLDKGAPINAACIRNTTPLHRAVQHGYVDSVELLIERGANIHALDARNSNALIHAAAGTPWNPDGTYVVQCNRGTTDNMLHIARLLLEQGADVNTQDIDDRTPMHHAVLAGGEAMVRLLLLFGPDLHRVDSGWLTPVETARAKITGGDEEAEIFRLLQAAATRRVRG